MNFSVENAAFRHGDNHRINISVHAPLSPHLDVLRGHNISIEIPFDDNQGASDVPINPPLFSTQTSCPLLISPSRLPEILAPACPLMVPLNVVPAAMTDASLPALSSSLLFFSSF